MKIPLHIKVLIPFLLALGAIVSLAPRAEKWGYDYKKGANWKYETLFAPFDIPILKPDEQLTQEREAVSLDAAPYYNFSFEVGKTAVERAAGMDFGQWSGVKEALLPTLERIYAKGVLPEDAARYGTDVLLYVHKDKTAQICPIVELYTLEAAKTYVSSFVAASCKDAPVDSLLGPEFLAQTVLPNLVFDAQTTALMNSAKGRADVSPTSGYIPAGQLIVSKGDVITSEVCQKLDSYKAEYEANVGYGGNRLLLWLGNTLLALAIVGALFFALFFNFRKVFVRQSQMLYLLLIFTIFSCLALLVERYMEDYMFLMPFTLGALFLQAFFKPRNVAAVYVAMLLPLLVFCENGVVFFTMYLLAGLFSFYVFPRFKKGVLQFVMAMMVFGILTLVFLGFRLVGAVNYDIVRSIVLLFIGSLLTVAGYPLVYLLERAFSLVSDNRLQELSDSSSELLKKLEQKAPGTFQHCLQVKNIACACARALNANELLVGAGAMYHDIGKMNNPACFVENESLIVKEGEGSYHSTLSPLQSAQDIIKHVQDGMEMAREAHLPRIVAAFIDTHHGNGCMSFFYDKYLKGGGDPSMQAEFCYKGRRPHTAEQTILMVADSVEAASRTLHTYTRESVGALVDSIVDGKIVQGQLAESEMTIREINMMKDIIVSYILQVHHERIKYPNR